MQEIYVPIGEDQRVKLTLVSTFQHIGQVRKYLHSIQDTFSVELDTCDTITQNLKIQCVSHRACRSCPLYILEFDDVSDGYALWKSAGDWALGTVLSSLFAARPASKHRAARLETQLAAHATRKHDPEFLAQALQKLNVDWDAPHARFEFDFALFVRLLDEAVAPEIGARTCDSYLELVSPLQYKSLTTMVVLRTKVAVSKQHVECSLKDYDARMRGLALARRAADRADSVALDRSHEASVLSDAAERSPSPPVSTSDDDAYLLSSSQQLLTNFQKHFRGMAETFETFDVKRAAQSPRRLAAPSDCWKVSKPVKNGKSKPSKVHA
ncbi:chromatin-associated RNAPIII regulator FPT1 [Lachancea thermotolerans CBS 6340]|uniref:KLTH0H09900p n=1 Tax=Lachancea thermotolerans (strain ATCC 56472 / CBS 6340 / NRRL Y-8284) TaxID=559295 RepID=C5E332_LACTC|nr:KLTH0H09900p [Lachancea thermotolerans CBS 6340]CAR30443.1 KLTH0H09900p [Lachancea thermotolerans CBS 6340]